jgi:hypothetical protein
MMAAKVPMAWRLILTVALMVAFFGNTSMGFTDVVRMVVIHRHTVAYTGRPTCVQPLWIHRGQRHRRSFSTLCKMAKRSKDDEKVGKEGEVSTGFNVSGFAAYLAPYVLALILSLAVTVAFVKAVMIGS